MNIYVLQLTAVPSGDVDNAIDIFEVETAMLVIISLS